LYNQEVKSIEVSKNHAKKVITTKDTFEADVLIGGADYQHIETQLLSKEYRSYSENYWDSRTLAPSCLIFYLGLNKKLENTLHHTLFFDVDFMQHAKEIYTTPKWPSEPLFYVSVPSKTDKSVAPEGCENVFILIPVAHTLEDTEEVREKYYHIVMDRFEKLTKQSIRESVVYKRSYAHKDFIADYHAFKGNAYGLANTLLQTAILKPSLKSKKVENLFYTGQLTVPGPGVPPSLISGQVVAKEVVKEFGRG
jgi:phytoene desaturase